MDKNILVLGLSLQLAGCGFAGLFATVPPAEDTCGPCAVGLIKEGRCQLPGGLDEDARCEELAFVDASLGADEPGRGTRERAAKTIGYALGQREQATHVLVRAQLSGQAAGKAVMVQQSVTIVGGLDEDFRRSDEGAKSRWLVDAPTAWRVQGEGIEVELHDLEIANVGEHGPTSVGLDVSGGALVRAVRLTIRSADGLAGMDGQPGDPGADGEPGDTGERAPGEDRAAGGLQKLCPESQGGRGGLGAYDDGQDQMRAATAGESSPAGTMGGAVAMPGSSGQSPEQAEHGEPASPGRFDEQARWVPGEPGTAGGAGEPGAGGGGGGGGTLTMIGAAGGGGGGGSGGCGGQGGTPGQSAGASLGVRLRTGAQLFLEESSIQAGDGGEGGDGGAGGPGGMGADGGEGDEGNVVGAMGARGGDGTLGGLGGQGGAGAGGMSVAVICTSEASLQLIGERNELQAGEPGVWGAPSRMQAEARTTFGCIVK